MWYAGAELSQAELIKRAFAGDDVQADFEAAKAAEVEEELPKEVTHSYGPFDCASLSNLPRFARRVHCQTQFFLLKSISSHMIRRRLT